MPDGVVQGLAGVIIAFLTYIGSRFVGRSAAKVAREQTDAQWNATYRSNAEQHLQWDSRLLSTVQQLQRLVNDLRRDMGRELIEFDEIPPAPALFPNPNQEK
ncbi:hypothetical protein [uncultured Friedmanniella sp.]|uniref:hypothetical protein n=1 Tax=uncultured Friedmanniella sp. TaxID=335381 RepID=UPI0035C9A2CF